VKLEEFQPMSPWYLKFSTSRTDRETDGRVDWRTADFP